MDEQINKRLDHIYWSIYLYNTSISELQIISNEYYSSDEIKIVNNSTFDFYRVTLQYCLVMEYCKLLEEGNKDNKKNISSLNKLNKIIFHNSNKKFCELYNENIHSIKNIKASPFYTKIKSLRDKKFGHADNDAINIPFIFEGFSTADIKNAFDHLGIIKIIFNNLGNVYGRNYEIEIPGHETLLVYRQNINHFIWKTT